jgi:CO/xanthine dehydrogenase Mo-binding subunit
MSCSDRENFATSKSSTHSARGVVVQQNFSDYPLLTLVQIPTAPALANVPFAATARRLRNLPYRYRAE